MVPSAGCNDHENILQISEGKFMALIEKNLILDPKGRPLRKKDSWKELQTSDAPLCKPSDMNLPKTISISTGDPFCILYDNNFLEIMKTVHIEVEMRHFIDIYMVQK